MGGGLAIDLGPIYTSESSCISVQISDFAKKMDEPEMTWHLVNFDA
jgi:hypothetical protein